MWDFFFNLVKKCKNLKSNIKLFKIRFDIKKNFKSNFLDLIYPEVLEKIIPAYENQIVHTLPIFAAFIDLFLTPKAYSDSFIRGYFPTLVAS